MQRDRERHGVRACRAGRNRLPAAVLAAVALFCGCGRRDADYPAALAAARRLFDRRQYDQAFQSFDRLRRRFPDRSEPYVDLARSAERLGRPADAIPAVRERVGRGGPEVHRYHDLLGGLLVEAGRRGEAENEFRKALQADAGYAPTYLHLSRLLARAGRIREALKIVGEGGARFPADSPLHAARGNLLLERGRWDEAERELRQALAGADPGGYPHYLLGRVYLNTGRLAEARRELEAATRLTPSAHPGWYQLANVCERLGDLAARDRALRRFAEVYRPQEMTDE